MFIIYSTRVQYIVARTPSLLFAFDDQYIVSSGDKMKYQQFSIMICFLFVFVFLNLVAFRLVLEYGRLYTVLYQVSHRKKRIDYLI